MQIRLLLGPAGSGKTHRCLAEIRAALSASPEGLPLLLLAPKQTTYQLERQLLAEGSPAGYTRLHILSFERLARFIFERVGRAPPALLNEEGRRMVLRGLLARARDDLKLFRASARLAGFAQQLSLVLREFQREQLTPDNLLEFARRAAESQGLSHKLHDLALMLREYLDWLAAHDLQDADCLLSRASEALGAPPTAAAAPAPTFAEDQLFLPITSCRGGPLLAQHLWVDGFAEFSEQELALLAALLPRCGGATLALCLDPDARHDSWLSHWSVVRQTVERCRKKFGSLPGTEVLIAPLRREESKGRFPLSPVLRHLEQHWASPQPFPTGRHPELAGSLRVVACGEPEAEATVAAREIMRYVRGGGRYREVTVLVRRLETYYQPLQRVFSRYGIPFFLDRRESVAHHPLAELTRSALRTTAFGWQQDDWFAALKTGLVDAPEEDIDRLENEALARGWRGAAWQTPLEIPEDPRQTAWVQTLQQRLLPPFKQLAADLAASRNKPSGPQLAAALRELWAGLGVEERLDEWAASESAGADTSLPGSVHATVWEQMNGWLQNVELAFANEHLSLREWLPVLEAGLAGLTVGLIPPALDQVLLGAIDRSRNPDIKVALILGLNENVFPARPEPTALLTDTERLALEKCDLHIGASPRHQLVRERYYAYLACTRARERVVLTFAQRDAREAPLSPSPFLARLKQLFPSLEFETAPSQPDWRESEHLVELIGPMLRLHRRRISQPGSVPSGFEQAPLFARRLEQLRHYRPAGEPEPLSSELAARLYGPVLRTSVSRMEQFAACPFKFFVHSGLRAEERKTFELDVKEQGSFQHDVLARFHEELRQEHKRWRDIPPGEARERIARVAHDLAGSYREGLFESDEQARFTARVLTESLQDFVETLVRWMHEQYQFDPVAVELPFGGEDASPSWDIELEHGHRLELHGRIDRVDLCRNGEEAWCVVVDYKSSLKQLDSLLLAHGLQLQLLAYLSVLRRWPNPTETFGVKRLAPAGVFYVNLRGKYDFESNREDALAEPEQARKLAYRHAGRFDASALPILDSRPGVKQGDQFNFRFTNDGRLYQRGAEALETRDFAALVDSVETHLRNMGSQVYAGNVEVSPFRKGTMVACDQCEYRALCRVDPWTHKYRILKAVKP